MDHIIQGPITDTNVTRIAVTLRAISSVLINSKNVSERLLNIVASTKWKRPNLNGLTTSTYASRLALSKIATYGYLVQQFRTFNENHSKTIEDRFSSLGEKKWAQPLKSATARGRFLLSGINELLPKPDQAGGACFLDDAGFKEVMSLIIGKEAFEEYFSDEAIEQMILEIIELIKSGVEVYSNMVTGQQSIEPVPENGGLLTSKVGESNVASFSTALTESNVASFSTALTESNVASFSTALTESNVASYKATASPGFGTRTYDEQKLYLDGQEGLFNAPIERAAAPTMKMPVVKSDHRKSVDGPMTNPASQLDTPESRMPQSEENKKTPVVNLAPDNVVKVIVSPDTAAFIKNGGLKSLPSVINTAAEQLQAQGKESEKQLQAALKEMQKQLQAQGETAVKGNERVEAAVKAGTKHVCKVVEEEGRETRKKTEEELRELRKEAREERREREKKEANERIEIKAAERAKQRSMAKLREDMHEELEVCKDLVEEQAKSGCKSSKELEELTETLDTLKADFETLKEKSNDGTNPLDSVVQGFQQGLKQLFNNLSGPASPSKISSSASAPPATPVPRCSNDNKSSARQAISANTPSRATKGTRSSMGKQVTPQGLQLNGPKKNKSRITEPSIYE